MMRALRFLLLAVIFAIPLGLAWHHSTSTAPNTVVLRARMPEAGGWSREAIYIEAGQTVTFRLTSDDVVHGFAIGRSSFEPVDIEPGKWTEITWTPALPGEYTFYCTRWCGANHWRMTGTIVVTDPTGSLPTPTLLPQPRHLIYGLDIDAREAFAGAEHIRPSALRGSDLHVHPSVSWMHPDEPDLTTPAWAWSVLRQDPALSHLDDLQLWDLLAHLWVSEMSDPSLATGETVYAANCAACHGSAGDGEGVMASNFSDPSPADFTNLARMATANNVILEGKILRGGMGTSMPYWGNILSIQQIEALLHYIWQFTFSGH